MTKTANNTATYTQEQLDALLQAERVQMANSFICSTLDPLQTLAKLFLAGPAEKEEWVDLNNLGDLLELAVLGAHMQALRLALKEDAGYSATPPYGFMLEDTMLEWKDARRQSRELREQAH